MKTVVFLVMDYGCWATGHRLWHCYNDAPRPIERLWWWANGIPTGRAT